MVKYKTVSGEVFSLVYWPEENLAEAIGPLPGAGEAPQAVPAAHSVYADFPDQAVKELVKRIGSGMFL